MSTSFDNERLTEFLRRRGDRLRLTTAAIGCFDSEQISYAKLSSSHSFDYCTPISASCVAKLCTASVILQAVLDGRLDLQSSVGTVLDGFVVDETLARVTVSQLIDHTHGLDASDLLRAPVQSDGYIDLETVLTRLRGRKQVSRAGEMFSYGHVGYILLGAMLERIYQLPFDKVLSSHLADRGGPTFARDETDAIRSICPATGGSLMLGAKEALELTRHYLWLLEQASQQPTAARLTSVWQRWQSLPGWSSAWDGHAFGWIRQRDGWFVLTGRAVSGECLSLVLDPLRSRGLVIASREERGSCLGPQLCSDLWQVPTAVPSSSALSHDAGEIEHEQYQGTYEDCSSKLTIYMEPRRLRVVVENKIDVPPFGSPRAGENFFRSPTKDVAFGIGSDAMFPFLHFLRASSGQAISHIWNGIRLWPRCEG